MKTHYMRQMYMGTIGDMKTLEQHFALMAERGWMIDQIGTFSHRYRATPPSKKRFFVDFLPQITAFDYPENEDAQDYRSFCEQSGWTFVAANKQFHVFCTEEDVPEPTPIHTDNKIQAQIYLKACRKYEIFQYMFPILILVFLFFTQYLRMGVEVFLSNILVFQIIGFSVFAIGYFWTIGFSFVWYQRTKKAAKLDLPLPIVSYRLSRIRNRTFSTCALICLVCMFFGVFLEVLGGLPTGFLLIIVMPFSALGVGIWIRRQINTKRRERKANIRLTIIAIVIMEIVFLSLTGYIIARTISDMPIPGSLGNRSALTLNSLGITSQPENTNTYIRGSVAVPNHYRYWEVNRQGNVHTEAYRTISKALTQKLYSRYVNELTEGYSDGYGIDCEITYFNSEEAASWGAEVGVAAFDPDGHTNELILLRGKTLLRLSFYGESINMETAAEAVRNLWSE